MKSSLPRSHVNAAPTPRHRLIVARPVVDEGRPMSEVAAASALHAIDQRPRSVHPASGAGRLTSPTTVGSSLSKYRGRC
ncbi:hypothetical protein DKM19_42195 [Streptosporangium sp. 'caverna']|nr:hypothetical protein DKM19_42195 [Streptosporangium sp. 'caverna']